MPAKIIDSESTAKNIISQFQEDLEKLKKHSIEPHLCAIRANNDPGTAWYAKAQAKHCAAHGIKHSLVDLGGDASQAAIAQAIIQANNDQGISAILLFMPLPAKVSALSLISLIAPEKDAEGIHPANLGELLVAGAADPAPCTAMAAVALAKQARPDLSGAKALVIGRSAIVGKPSALLLLSEHATVTVAHTRSDIRDALLEAEVVIAAAGASGAKWRSYENKRMNWTPEKGKRPDAPDLTPLVTMDMVRRGAIVIDVGDNYIPEGLDKDGLPLLNDKGKPAMKYAGDVDFAKVSEVAGFVTNPRGGVGPVTNAFLLKNTVKAALKIAERNK